MGGRRSCLLACLFTATAVRAPRAAVSPPPVPVTQAVSASLPAGLPAAWAVPSVQGLPVAPAVPALPAAPARVRFGLPGPDRLPAGATGAELHGLEGSDHLLGAAAADRLFGDTGGDTLAGRGGADL